MSRWRVTVLTVFMCSRSLLRIKTEFKVQNPASRNVVTEGTPFGRRAHFTRHSPTCGVYNEIRARNVGLVERGEDEVV